MKSFLFCLKSLDNLEEWSRQINVLSRLQKKKGGQDIKVPDDPFKVCININAPGWQEEREMETGKEMSRPPRRQARVE